MASDASEQARQDIPLRVLLVGVGGQGVLTAARLLGEAAMLAGKPVRVGQMHGMSQRGGSVQATVSIGPGHSSFIPAGQADVVVGLEPLELRRARPAMNATTNILVNLATVVPSTLAMQGKPYPELQPLLEAVRAVTPNVTTVDGAELVAALGDLRGLNMIMLGAISKMALLPFDDEVLWQAIEKRSPARRVAMNRKAFGIGREAVTT